MRRLKRIFASDGKTVIVAMDHGLGLSVLPELSDTETVIRKIVQGGADAVITSYGIAARYGDAFGRAGLIVRLDGGNTILGSGMGGSLLYSVEDAIRVGADGVVCMGFPGARNEAETLENIAKVAGECRYWQLPLVAEMLPGGFNAEPPNTVENIKLVARIGAELGANIIKTSFTGSVEEYREITASCFAPIVVLGGDKTGNIADLFKTIEKAMAAGVAGVAIGRNVWKTKKPERVVRALVGLVHESKKAEEVLSLIDFE